MAVPHLIALSTDRGPTAGRSIVELTATGLRVPPDPPAEGVAPPTPATVAVWFGAERSPDVRVISQGRLWCTTPIHDPGTVDVKVQNLDDNGDPIPGEEATLADAYTYERPDLVAPSGLQEVVAAYVRELRRQVLANTVISTHVDYAEDPQTDAYFANLATLPAVVVTGPTLGENRFYGEYGPRAEAHGGDVLMRRPRAVADLRFTVLAGSDTRQQVLNLVHALTLFYHRNPELRVPVEGGEVLYELHLADSAGGFGAVSTPNESNLHVFSGETIIRAVTLDEPTAAAVDAASELTHEISEVVVESPQQMQSRRILGRVPLGDPRPTHGSNR